MTHICDMCEVNEAQHWVKDGLNPIRAMCAPCVGVLQATIDDAARRKLEKAQEDEKRSRRRAIKSARRRSRR